MTFPLNRHTWVGGDGRQGGGSCTICKRDMLWVLYKTSQGGIYYNVSLVLGRRLSRRNSTNNIFLCLISRGHSEARISPHHRQPASKTITRRKEGRVWGFSLLPQTRHTGTRWRERYRGIAYRPAPQKIPAQVGGQRQRGARTQHADHVGGDVILPPVLLHRRCLGSIY